MREILKKRSGITLIALVVTIVILIILATISVSLIINGGIINKTESSAELHKREGAKEKLNLALGSAGLEKRLNKKYNQDEFLDELIQKEIKNVRIEENIVTVDGYAFEIDRSVPKIGRYIGKESELVFPEIQLDATNAEDSRTATIKITAKEETNGINKIEIWQNGFVIKTYEYESVKEEITENFVVKQNGIYNVKVYAGLTGSRKVEVKGLVASVEYSPNGNEEYKKEHKVKVSADEKIEKVKSIKYQWLQTTAEPGEDTFTTECENGAIIVKNEITGVWYLWTLLETESGKKNIGRSEAFYFDNEEPSMELTSTPVSETSFKISIKASDISQIDTIVTKLGEKEYKATQLRTRRLPNNSRK